MPDTQTPPATATLPLLCVVIPVFNEEPVLPELLERLQRVLGNLTTVRWEVVFVDDGSRDRTAAMLAAAAVLEPRLRLVRLSRNFGHQPALTAGLSQAGLADAVVTMDADLQDPPELIPELVAAWQAGAEVVLAVRRSRQEGGLRRVGFNAFHRWFQRWRPSMRWRSATVFSQDCGRGSGLNKRKSCMIAKSGRRARRGKRYIG